MGLMRRKASLVTMIVLVAAALSGSIALAASVDDKQMLKSFHRLDIFGLTGEMVDLTGDMLNNTRQLSERIGEVGQSLSMLDVQKAELSAQVMANAEIKNQLVRQLELNKEARGLMQEILALQGNTAVLTTQVVSKVSGVTTQVIQSAGELNGVAGTTEELNRETDLLLGKLTQLNQELDRAADSFRFVGRLTELSKLLPVPVLDTLPSLPNGTAPLQQVTEPLDGLLPNIVPPLNTQIDKVEETAEGLLPLLQLP